MVGGALGSMIAPGVGTALGSQLGSAASNLFELELESMPQEAGGVRGREASGRADGRGGQPRGAGSSGREPEGGRPRRRRPGGARVRAGPAPADDAAVRTDRRQPAGPGGGRGGGARRGPQRAGQPGMRPGAGRGPGRGYGGLADFTFAEPRPTTGMPTATVRSPPMMPTARGRRPAGGCAGAGGSSCWGSSRHGSRPPRSLAARAGGSGPADQAGPRAAVRAGADHGARGDGAAARRRRPSRTT